jgi:hypothetical protein
VNGGRRFSQAISEGDGISLVAEVDGAEAAARAEADGAEAVFVSPAIVETLRAVRPATTLPLIALWPGNPPADLVGIDACVLPVHAEREWLERQHRELRDGLEIAFWVEHEEEIETALEAFDPEVFILAAPDPNGEEAIEHVLDLLADVPAGKLAIAEVAVATREDVAALERAGFDAVIVQPQQVADLVGEEPPEV